MATITILFLSSLEFSVQLLEFLQVQPAGDHLFIYLRDSLLHGVLMHLPIRSSAGYTMALVSLDS